MATEFDFSQPITSDVNVYATYNCSAIDPSHPTLDNLVTALEGGNPSSIYPLGTFCPDVFKVGSTIYDFNWVVVHYGTGVCPSISAQPIDGVYLMSSIALTDTNALKSDVSRALGQYDFYSGAQFSSLTTNIVPALSDDIKNKVVPVNILYDHGVWETYGHITITNARSAQSFFVPSATNLGGSNPSALSQPPVFDYFTGVSESELELRRTRVSIVNTPTNYFVSDIGTARPGNAKALYDIVQTSGTFYPFNYEEKAALVLCCFIPA